MMPSPIAALECPRCNGFIPSNEHPNAHSGALSRIDNTIEICSACGSEEALLQIFAEGVTYPLTLWPLWQYDDAYTSACRQRYLQSRIMILRGFATIAVPTQNATECSLL